jgi:hypothetical protein
MIEFMYSVTDGLGFRTGARHAGCEQGQTTGRVSTWSVEPVLTVTGVASCPPR